MVTCVDGLRVDHIREFGRAKRLTLCKAALAAVLIFCNTAAAQEQRPILGAFGLPGAIEMPDAAALRDGDIALSFSSFAGEPRYSLTFQMTPRLTGVFRYSKFGQSDVGTPWDRSFSLHYKFLDETRWGPAAAIGMSDTTGTSISPFPRL
jgi:hypothetical protein